ncbi:GspH/FimT family pseudopilin [Alishewanella sp. BS5-314]|uniref:GspH/FimT family pseudopilin n=1 Tax=Alishewanella sp. BS5-314 TaxID=2755587 RepID=UPI0021BA51C7|nr:GspH/FimT family pseudopilin [Alishewanella sp. BS5-314]MCT8124501.1 GspH/FimT family pseudopilin [Alishewanella sp. BS5-314]
MQKANISGFTLIEVMVTVAVLAIVITVAVPSFGNLLAANRLTGQSNEILGALALARNEAIKQNQDIVFCHSNDLLVCENAPAAGWRGYLVLRPADNTVIAAGRLSSANLILLASPAVNNSTRNNVNQVIRFNPQGVVRQGNQEAVLNGVLRVCTNVASINPNSRDIQLRSGGRVRIVQIHNAGCNAPANLA